SATSQTPAAPRQIALLLSSVGQGAEEPVQFSAVSQMPAEARHVVEFGTKLSAGHVLLIPSQLSATSQTPAALRQTALLLPSAGQAAAEPVHFSAGSQTPADARH